MAAALSAWSSGSHPTSAESDGSQGYARERRKSPSRRDRPSERPHREGVGSALALPAVPRPSRPVLLPRMSHKAMSLALLAYTWPRRMASLRAERAERAETSARLVASTPWPPQGRQVSGAQRTRLPVSRGPIVGLDPHYRAGQGVHHPA